MAFISGTLIFLQSDDVGVPSGIYTVLKSKCHRPERKRKATELLFSLF